MPVYSLLLSPNNLTIILLRPTKRSATSFTNSAKNLSLYKLSM